MKHQANDAVVLKGGQSDQLRRCCDDDPKCGMGQEVHGQLRGCASSLLTRCSTELRRV
jgi:hypothetical protein